MDKEITDEESQPEDTSKLIKQFEKEGWKLHFNDIQIQLIKEFNQYRVFVMANAMTLNEKFGQFKDDRFYE